MMQKYLFIAISIILTGFCKGQVPDSLVFFEELIFENPSEEAAFQKYFIEEDQDIFLLLSVSGNHAEASEINANRQGLDQWLSQFETEKFTKQKASKKIKSLAKRFNTAYIETYDINAYFNHLFSEKIYNELTSSALWGTILERLDIPYQIKQSYESVKVVVFPDSESVVLEATDPLIDVIFYDPQTKTEFISFLISTQQVEEKEVKEETVDDLFDKYYFRDNETTLIGLAASMYYKNAVLLFEKQLYKEAFRMAEKSYFLKAESKTGFLLLSCIGTELNNCQYTDLDVAPYVYKASRYTSFGITSENIRDEFLKITQLVLISRYDKKLYEQFYKEITDHITDTSMIHEISFIYHYESGRILQNEGKYAEALPYTEKAYALKPDHMDAKNLFLNSIIFSMTEFEDPNEALIQMNEYAHSYPDIGSSPHFMNMRYVLLLGLCVDEFTRGNYTDGFSYLHSFEKSAGNKSLRSTVFPVQDILVEAYSLAASYYFRKGNYSEAKKYLETGLVYAPGNWELQNKMRAIR